VKVLGTTALAVAGVIVALFATLALRDATLSTHQSVPPGSRIELVVDARTKGGEIGQTLSEMVEAQVLLCRLEVSSDLVGDVEAMGLGRYRAVLAPSMDESNRRQFRGCLEDWVLDHVRLDGVSLIPA
jgi:hypothetical protein